MPHLNEDDVCSSFGESKSSGFSDASSAAGDEGSFSRKVEEGIHSDCGAGIG